MTYKSSQINSLKYKLVSKEELVFLYDSTFIKDLLPYYENSFLPIGIPPFRTVFLKQNIKKKINYSQKESTTKNTESIIKNYIENKLADDIPILLLIKTLDNFFTNKNIGRNILFKRWNEFKKKSQNFLVDLSIRIGAIPILPTLYSESDLSLLSDNIKSHVQDIFKESLKFHDSRLSSLLFYKRIIFTCYTSAPLKVLYSIVQLLLLLASMSIILFIFILFTEPDFDNIKSAFDIIKSAFISFFKPDQIPIPFKLNFDHIIPFAIPIIIFTITIIISIYTLILSISLLILTINSLNFLISQFVITYMNQKGVESLCIRELIYLLFDLSRDDANHRIDIRKILYYRMEYIAKLTLLIPKQYQVENQEHKDWIEQHFKNISTYITERSRWILAPSETTLNYLRDDFYKLTYVYLTGSYGDFQWQPTLIKTQKYIPLNFWKTLSKYLHIIIITSRLFIVPVLMIAYLSEKLPIVPVNQNDKRIAILLFWGWVLVTLDKNLKLGVLESVIKAVKGIKNLVK